MLDGLAHIHPDPTALISRLEKLDRDHPLPRKCIPRATTARLANNYRELEKFVLICEREV